MFLSQFGAFIFGEIESLSSSRSHLTYYRKVNIIYLSHTRLHTVEYGLSVHLLVGQPGGTGVSVYRIQKAKDAVRLYVPARLIQSV